MAFSFNRLRNAERTPNFSKKARCQREQESMQLRLELAALARGFVSCGSFVVVVWIFVGGRWVRRRVILPSSEASRRKKGYGFRVIKFPAA